MRTTLDRIRHAVLFELILICICLPILSFATGESAMKSVGFAAFMSLTAMVWNYVYNVLFDKSLIIIGIPLSPRGITVRSIHALLFELGLIIAIIPATMIFMGLSLWQAIVLELAFLIMVPIYTVFFNLAYDKNFPISVEST